MKKRVLVIGILAVLAVFLFGLAYAYFFLFDDNTIRVIVNGKTFSVTYREGGYQSINQVLLSQATLKQLSTIPSDRELPAEDLPPIKDFEQAAEQGIALLEASYSSWTYDNNVIVSYNPNAGAWVIHGQMKDRECPGVDGLGLLIVEEKTGKVVVLRKGSFDVT